MKDMGFLNNLDMEVKNAINGEGVSLLEIKKLCDTSLRLLSEIEDKREITSDSSYKKTAISNIDLSDEDCIIFKSIIDDLQEKVIIHEEDLRARKDPLIFQDTHTIEEIQNGKKMILTDTIIFRKYKSKLKKIIEDLAQEEKIRISEASTNPSDILSKRIKLPKIDPVFIYDTKDIIFFNGKKYIILNTITGFSKVLLLYFMNNPNISINERDIEKNLEFFLRNTKSRGDRATYSAITKLRSKLKSKTGKDFFTKIKDIYENVWIFDPNLP